MSCILILRVFGLSKQTSIWLCYSPQLGIENIPIVNTAESLWILSTLGQSGDDIWQKHRGNLSSFWHSLWLAAKNNLESMFGSCGIHWPHGRSNCLYFGEDEMEVVLTKMETFCTGSGRASQLGCYVQTISWTNGVRDNENFQIMNGSFWLQDVGVDTLQGTNISPKNGILKMIFLFPRWDMLIPWRVIVWGLQGLQWLSLIIVIRSIPPTVLRITKKSMINSFRWCQ